MLVAWQLRSYGKISQMNRKFNRMSYKFMMTRAGIKYFYHTQIANTSSEACANNYKQILRLKILCFPMLKHKRLKKTQLLINSRYPSCLT